MDEKEMQEKLETCNKECEVYSRVTGFLRPVCHWNDGKKEEFKQRVVFDINKHFKESKSPKFKVIMEDGKITGIDSMENN